MIQDSNQIPRHVAIVMDGNGRWATRRLLPRTAGHREGVKAARNIIQVCGEQGISVLTLFAFSSENWKRPKTEVSTLMQIFLSSLDAEIQTLNENGVRLRFIGELQAFPDALRERIAHAEEITQANNRFHLNIAVNYGGRWDIVNAVQSLCNKVLHKEIRLEQIDEAVMSGHVALSEFSPPDLFIRTGGEKRISNFLLWQIAYTELYFTETLWPDFGEKELLLAINDFASRQRRYGMTQDQISGENNA